MALGNNLWGFFLKCKLQYLYLPIALVGFARGKIVLASGKEALVSSTGHKKLPFTFSM